MIGQRPQGNDDEPAYPLEVVMPDQVTRLTITRDMAIKALKHVEDGTYPPPDAPREDLMAVQYLLRKEGERLRAEKAELLRRKEEADASSARRAAYSFTASTEVSQGARRHRARVPLMTEVDRARVTRNLESSYIEDADGIPVPKTPGAALMAVETYLRLTQPPEGDSRALLHKQQIMSIKALEDALVNKAPTEKAREDRDRRDHEPAALAAPATQECPRASSSRQKQSSTTGSRTQDSG
jgi:hypothetical protein